MVDPKKRFVGRISDRGSGTEIVTKASRPARIVNQIPDDILNDEDLQRAISVLPSNYNFEIPKCIWNIRKQKAKMVALQLPEGLLLYACILSDIFEQFCGVQTLVMGDVTYGACCIDDFTAKSLGCDMLIHYAHSCLVPVDVTSIKVLYVFVTIDIDRKHLLNTLLHHFSKGDSLSLVGTIQFNQSVHAIREELESNGISASTPQCMPLSRGEVLGCTSGKITIPTTAIVYIGDGRFHLESAMINNPEIPAYKYDPYSKKFTIEEYDFDEMRKIRRSAVDSAKNAKHVGLILGALGRQGNPETLEMLKREFEDHGANTTVVALSEIFPQKLAMFDGIDCWVQVACPRLSIDWGYAFPKPLLTPYEAMVALGEDRWMDVYPMDYYAKDGYGRGKRPQRPALVEGK